MGLRSPAAPVKTLDVSQNCGQFTQFNNLWVLDRAQARAGLVPSLALRAQKNRSLLHNYGDAPGIGRAQLLMTGRGPLCK